MATVLVLHGPNLNLLGEREPGIYGADSLENINKRLVKQGERLSCAVRCEQRNAEVDLIELIHAARGDGTQFLIFNPAAYTHTSIALRDALSASGLPFVEVHLSNVHAREAFRHQSYFSDIAEGVICGLGASGYEYALQFAVQHLTKSQPPED
ncbi:MAG: type II 3-dehydroquinate dehydratase [Congregibacter sp.]